MVKTASKPTEPLSTRRTFLSKLWVALGCIALLQIVTGAVAFLVSGRKQQDTEKEASIEAGSIDDFMPGSVTLIRKGNCYLTRLEDGGFLAISRKCTHLGCLVPWVEERHQFECPCHASIFDISGNVLKAPAPRALDLYSISFNRKTVIIHTSVPIKRSLFTPEQPVYPPAWS